MPSLIIIAGPNGAGKSTISEKLLIPNGTHAFDFDKVFYNNWSRFDFDPFVEEGVRDTSIEEFQNHMEHAFLTGIDVAFETNYHSQSVFRHIIEAKNHGFKTELVYIGLDSVDLAISRVHKRVVEGGHPVDKRDYPSAILSRSKTSR